MTTSNKHTTTSAMRRKDDCDSLDFRDGRKPAHSKGESRVKANAHTPGPWTWWSEKSGRPKKYDLAKLISGKSDQSHEGKVILCTYGGAGIEALGTSKVDIANARLIAAAPETAAERDRLKKDRDDGLDRELALTVDLNTALLQRDALLAACKRLTRWVGKGIADKSFENCVLPKAAESDLAFAEAAIKDVEAQQQ